MGVINLETLDESSQSHMSDDPVDGSVPMMNHTSGFKDQRQIQTNTLLEPEVEDQRDHQHSEVQTFDNADEVSQSDIGGQDSIAHTIGGNQKAGFNPQVDQFEEDNN